MVVDNKPVATSSSSVGRSGQLPLRDVVLMVTLSTVFGFLYWVLVQAWMFLQVAMGPAGNLSEHVLHGGWLLVAPISIAIIRRPGVGIIAEIIAACIEVVFLGSPAGPTLLIAAFLQGFGSELPFFVTRYRHFSWVVYGVSGLAGSVSVFFYSAFRSGWFGQDIFWLRFGLQAASGIVLGGLLAKVIVSALLRTGALSNFAIARAGSA